MVPPAENNNELIKPFDFVFSVPQFQQKTIVLDDVKKVQHIVWVNPNSIREYIILIYGPSSYQKNIN